MKLRRHIPKLLALALSWLLIGYIAYVYAQSTTIYIMAGIYPGAPTYTVWVESSTYYAKDANGQIDYSGTNASQIFNSVASIGGKILIKNGDYSINAPILILTNGTVLEGETRGKNLVATPTSGVNFIGTVALAGSTLIRIGDATHIVRASGLRNLNIHGSDLGGNGVEIYGNQCFMENCIVWHFLNSGIVLYPSSSENWFDHIVSAGNGESGIYVGSGDTLLSNIVANTNGIGISFVSTDAYEAGGSQLTNFHVWNNTHGIMLSSVINMVISNGMAENNDQTGIYIYAHNHAIARIDVSNVIFWVNNATGADWPHVLLACDGSDIVNFVFYGNTFDASTNAFANTTVTGGLQGGLVIGNVIAKSTDIAPATYAHNLGYP